LGNKASNALRKGNSSRDQNSSILPSSILSQSSIVSPQSSNEIVGRRLRALDADTLPMLSRQHVYEQSTESISFESGSFTSGPPFAVC
jgi:hypothetical protein